MQNKVPTAVPPKAIETEEESLERSKDSKEMPVDEDMMKDFMKDVSIIQKKVDEVAACNLRIHELAVGHAKATLSDEEKRISTEINAIITQGEKARDVIKAALDKLDTDIESTAKKVEEAKDSQEPPELRMKRQISNTLRLKFQEQLQRTNEAQVEFKKAAQNKIRRQLKIVKPELTEDQLEELSRDNEAGNQLMSQMMLEAHGRVIAAVSDIKQKYDDVLRLERVHTQSATRIERGSGAPDVQGPRCAGPRTGHHDGQHRGQRQVRQQLPGKGRETHGVRKAVVPEHADCTAAYANRG